MKDENEAGKDGKPFQALAEDIKSAIVTGELKPGQRLVEAQLCERFRVKRNRIRDALRILEVEGFVQITPNVGAAVKGLSRIEVENAYDIMGALDGLSVRLSTPLLTRSQLDHMGNLLDRMEVTDKLTDYARYNDEYHGMFAENSANERLNSIAENMRLILRVFGHRSFFVPGQLDASNVEHRNVFRLVMARQPEQAETAMRDHVAEAKKRLLDYIQSLIEQFA